MRGDFASRSKGKSETTKKGTCWLLPSGTIPIETKGTWIDIEPGQLSLSLCAFEVSKKVIHLLRLGQHKHREDDGAVQFWRIEENLQKHFPYCLHWSVSKWKKSMAEGRGGSKKRLSVLYRLIRSNLVPPSSSRSFRKQSY